MSCQLDVWLTKFFMGNLIWSGVAQSELDIGVELHCLVGNLRNAISKINVDFISQKQGEEGFPKVIERPEELREADSDKGANYYTSSSMCNGGIYI